MISKGSLLHKIFSATWLVSVALFSIRCNLKTFIIYTSFYVPVHAFIINLKVFFLLKTLYYKSAHLIFFFILIQIRLGVRSVSELDLLASQCYAPRAPSVFQLGLLISQIPQLLHLLSAILRTKSLVFFNLVGDGFSPYTCMSPDLV